MSLVLVLSFFLMIVGVYGLHKSEAPYESTVPGIITLVGVIMLK